MEKSTHRRRYQENYGDIPPGHIIHHIDHNHKNNDPENLVAIPEGIHIRYHNYHQELEAIDPREIIDNSPSYLKKFKLFRSSYETIKFLIDLRPDRRIII